MAAWIAAMLTLACLLRESKCFTLVADPTYQHVEANTRYMFLCQADVPLKGCQVKNFDDSVIDLSEGNRSTNYFGTGLDNGQCGFASVSSSSVGKFYQYGCRVRARNGLQWEYAASVIYRPGNYVDGVLTMDKSPPAKMEVQAGTEVTLDFTAHEPLWICSFQWSGQPTWVFNGSTNAYKIDNSDLALGRCQLTLYNVMAEQSGIIICQLQSAANTHGKQRSYIHLTTLIVKMAPSAPVLSLNKANGVYIEDDVMLASCHVGPARPVPRVTWLLNNDVIQGDFEDFTKEPWDFEAAEVTRKLSRKLSKADDGKELVCRVHHAALERGVADAWAKVTVRRVTGDTSHEPTTVLPVVPTASSTQRCPALSTDSITVSCSLGGARVECVKEDAPLGTTARLACRDGFIHRSNHPDSLTTTCKPGRHWRPNPITCDLDCGLRKGNANQLSVGGKVAHQAEFPWHVAVFRKDGDSYKLICGGSLITRKHFVSAAHCFWSDSTNRAMDKALYKASLGKQSLPWETRDEHEQRSDVREVHVHENYNGYKKQFESDIAVVELSAAIEVTEAVSVACVDWSNSFEFQQLTAGNLGTVPGWGIDESNKQSPTLRFVDLPFVSNPDCRETVPWDFKDYLIIDKFCGGYTNKSTSVCPGDSGGGFVFPTSLPIGVRYYLRGIVSMSAKVGIDKKCQTEHRTMFTKVSVYVDWMGDIVFADSK